MNSEDVTPEKKIQELLLEIARLHMDLKKKDEYVYSLKKSLDRLREKNIIDQWNRILPLENHHKDCAHGQTGWAYCSCEELSRNELEKKE